MDKSEKKRAGRRIVPAEAPEAIPLAKGPTLDNLLIEMKIKTVVDEFNNWVFPAWKKLHKLMMARIEDSALYKASSFTYEDKEHLPLYLFLEMYPKANFMNFGNFIANPDAGPQEINSWTLDYIDKYQTTGDKNLLDYFLDFYQNCAGERLDTELLRYSKDKSFHDKLFDQIKEIKGLSDELKENYEFLSYSLIVGFGTEYDLIYPPPFLLLKRKGILEELLRVFQIIYGNREIVDDQPEDYVLGMFEETLENAQDINEFKIDQRLNEVLSVFDEANLNTIAQDKLKLFLRIIQSMDIVSSPERYKYLAMFTEIKPENVSFIVRLLYDEKANNKYIASKISIFVNGKWEDEKKLTLFQKQRYVDDFETEGRRRTSERLVNRSARILLADLAIASGFQVVSEEEIKETNILKKPVNNRRTKEAILKADPNMVSELNTMYRRIFGLQIGDEVMINRKDGVLNVALMPFFVTERESIMERIEAFDTVR